jgi:hypothetical protein
MSEVNWSQSVGPWLPRYVIHRAPQPRLPAMRRKEEQHGSNCSHRTHGVEAREAHCPSNLNRDQAEGQRSKTVSQSDRQQPTNHCERTGATVQSANWERDKLSMVSLRTDNPTAAGQPRVEGRRSQRPWLAPSCHTARRGTVSHALQASGVGPDTFPPSDRGTRRARRPRTFSCISHTLCPLVPPSFRLLAWPLRKQVRGSSAAQPKKKKKQQGRRSAFLWVAEGSAGGATPLACSEGEQEERRTAGAVRFSSLLCACRRSGRGQGARAVQG